MANESVNGQPEILNPIRFLRSGGQDRPTHAAYCLAGQKETLAGSRQHSADHRLAIGALADLVRRLLREGPGRVAAHILQGAAYGRGTYDGYERTLRKIELDSVSKGLIQGGISRFSLHVLEDNLYWRTPCAALQPVPYGTSNGRQQDGRESCAQHQAPPSGREKSIGVRRGVGHSDIQFLFERNAGDGLFRG